MSVLVCNKNNYNKYATKQHLILAIIDGIEDKNIRVYTPLYLSDVIKSYTKYIDGNLDYVKKLLNDFLSTSKAKSGLRILREMSLHKEIILICDNMGIVFFSSILTEALRNAGIVVQNYGGNDEQ